MRVQDVPVAVLKGRACAEPCFVCEFYYGPVEVVKGGIRKLGEFKGYTVDYRLRQFRRMKPHELPEYIEFSDEAGLKLLWEMHETIMSK